MSEFGVKNDLLNLGAKQEDGSPSSSYIHLKKSYSSGFLYVKGREDGRGCFYKYSSPRENSGND